MEAPLQEALQRYLLEAWGSWCRVRKSSCVPQFERHRVEALPKYSLVTGCSAPALQAHVALLGSTYDWQVAYHTVGFPPW